MADGPHLGLQCSSYLGLMVQSMCGTLRIRATGTHSVSMRRRTGSRQLNSFPQTRPDGRRTAGVSCSLLGIPEAIFTSSTFPDLWVARFPQKRSSWALSSKRKQAKFSRQEPRRRPLVTKRAKTTMAKKGKMRAPVAPCVKTRKLPMGWVGRTSKSTMKRRCKYNLLMKNWRSNSSKVWTERRTIEATCSTACYFYFVSWRLRCNEVGMCGWHGECRP
mmetsp:Transcript_35062/g.110332  ORF Transcript_35062/g.110332 Transcript_35062/m.110332 type:complete len:218 (+) Transcript_35062:889-1542(+)